MIACFWIAYTLFSMSSDDGVNDFHFLHWVFLIFSFVYLGYVLVHNAPVFGTQSYLEFTPGYIVHKGGLFRAKQAFAAEDIASLEFVAQQLRIKLKAGDQYNLSMREVRGTRRKRTLREQVRTFAQQHQVVLRETQANA
jgi:hypothetical protein